MNFVKEKKNFNHRPCVASVCTDLCLGLWFCPLLLPVSDGWNLNHQVKTFMRFNNCSLLYSSCACLRAGYFYFMSWNTKFSPSHFCTFPSINYTQIRRARTLHHVISHSHKRNEISTHGFYFSKVPFLTHFFSLSSPLFVSVLLTQCYPIQVLFQRILRYMSVHWIQLNKSLVSHQFKPLKGNNTNKVDVLQTRRLHCFSPSALSSYEMWQHWRLDPLLSEG